MKLKTIKKTSVLLLLSSFIFCACQEEFPEDDLIQGKWKLESVVNDENALECEKKAYIEFSKYVYESSERKLYKANYCDIPEDAENQDEPIIIENTYTVVLDTLIIVDEHRDTKKYIIEHINKETMTLLDKYLTPTNYVRAE
ncbi:MAG: lipocalin family protein [Bacteroidales bacterium]|jgi:hypothetical protein|nr:lipocalin family protein [Bacteroidales bacterium]